MTHTLLITGGAGFIGSCFVRMSLAAGYKAVVLDKLTYAGHPKNLAGVDAELIVGDIADRTLVDTILNKHRPTAIVHFAAESHVDRSIARSDAFIHTNIVGTHTLLEAARNYSASAENFRFLHISTDEVFGALGPEGAFTEQSPYAPSSPYSASKAAADHLVRAWHHTYGLPAIITHSGNNYGPRQWPEKLIPRLITRALAGEQLPLYGDGKQVREWIHVEDYCAGLLAALRSGIPGQHYCFSGKVERTNLDLAQQICQLLDELHPRADSMPYSKLIRFVADRPGHDRRYALDGSKAEREIGFVTTRHFEEGLRETVQWYLANR